MGQDAKQSQINAKGIGKVEVLWKSGDWKKHKDEIHPSIYSFNIASYHRPRKWIDLRAQFPRGKMAWANLTEF